MFRNSLLGMKDWLVDTLSMQSKRIFIPQTITEVDHRSRFLRQDAPSPRSKSCPPLAKNNSRSSDFEETTERDRFSSSVSEVCVEIDDDLNSEENDMDLREKFTRGYFLSQNCGHDERSSSEFSRPYYQRVSSLHVSLKRFRAATASLEHKSVIRCVLYSLVADIGAPSVSVPLDTISEHTDAGQRFSPQGNVEQSRDSPDIYALHRFVSGHTSTDPSIESIPIKPMMLSSLPYPTRQVVKALQSQFLDWNMPVSGNSFSKEGLCFLFLFFLGGGYPLKPRIEPIPSLVDFILYIYGTLLHANFKKKKKMYLSSFFFFSCIMHNFRSPLHFIGFLSLGDGNC